MKWVKASERLPEKSGIENKVIARGTHHSHTFISYAFKNFDEQSPFLYTCVGALSFLSTKKEPNFHSTYPVDCVEWLDESPSTELQQAQERIKELEEVVRELVETYHVPASPTKSQLKDYLKRKTLAWQAARTALNPKP